MPVTSINKDSLEALQVVLDYRVVSSQCVLVQDPAVSKHTEQDVPSPLQDNPWAVFYLALLLITGSNNQTL